MTLHQYGSTETPPGPTTYPGAWADPATVGPLVKGIRKTGKEIYVRLNP